MSPRSKLAEALDQAAESQVEEMINQAGEIKFSIGEACFLLAENRKDICKGIVDNMAPTTTCHGVPLGPHYIRIRLTDCYAATHPLQRPHAGAKTLGESVGSFLAWPTTLLREGVAMASARSYPDTYKVVIHLVWVPEHGVYEVKRVTVPPAHDEPGW